MTNKNRDSQLLDNRLYKAYGHCKCDINLSFPDTLMEDEELMHVHWGVVTYTGACMVMDRLRGERYRCYVEIAGELKKTSYHKLIRKNNAGTWSVRLCHSNPDFSFCNKHFF